MKGGYLIFDVKKCNFIDDTEEGQFYAQNQYTKDFATALYKSNKTVLIENLNTLSDTYSKYKNSLFAKDIHLYTDGTYINFSLPVGSEPSVYVYANGTITIDN